MPLRLLEVTLPNGQLDRVREMVEEVGAIDLWTTPTEGDTGIARILVEAEGTEALMDRLTESFGSREDFRILLLPVEATLPAVEKAEAPPDQEAEATGEPGDGEGKEEAPKRISREELYDDIAQASEVTSTFVAMVTLSTVVAAVGLIRGDVAIIIGAMVIAPLLGPNMGLSLAATLGDTDLARRSLRAIGAGVAASGVGSILLGLLLEVDPSSPQLALRTGAELGDIVLALAAGSAGSLAFTSGVPAVVVGVMVAVALLPPLVASGLFLGAGHLPEALGAGLLVLTNVTCVNLAAVATFLARRVRPRTWWEADRAKKATRIAVTTWVLMLAALVVLILLT